MEKGGLFTIGAPEDLVLSGSLERAFKAPGVDFDRLSGSFCVRRKPGRPVALLAGSRDEAWLWTQKALLRAGFDVKQNPDDAPVQIRISNEQNRPVWLLAANSGKEQRLDSIARMLSALDGPGSREA
jgi:iron complex transport system ATP-binding protein